MQRSNTPIVKYIPQYLEYCEVEKGLSPVSTRNYDNFLKVFTSWLKEKNLLLLKPYELTADHIWNYRLFLSRKKDLKGAYIKKTTQNYYLIALRNLLNYFTDRDITSLPAGKIKLPKLTDQDKAIKFLRSEQIEKLMTMPDMTNAQGMRDRAILEVLFSTGVRVSELTSLNIEAFDVKNIVQGKIKDYELSITGKGGRVRPVYFSPRALRFIGIYVKTRKDLYPPLFINYRPDKEDKEHRLTPRSVERMVRRNTVMAGLPVHATPHTMRHSFATDLLEQGADVRAVQELLGHKNILTTQIYTHVTNPMLRDTHRRFHGGNKDKS